MTPEIHGKQYVIGLFPKEDQAVSAIHALMDSPWEIDDVYSPVPSKKIQEALYMKPSRVGWFTLCGGILGFIAGLALTVFSASQWSLMVSGKPVISLVPFFIVSFELTILFSVIGNVIGFLWFSGLPTSKPPRHYFQECSGRYFGVVAACRTGDLKKLVTFFDEHGGEARIY
jgi:molybdopterin-containing oxidoreductase family membrane subunit